MNDNPVADTGMNHLQALLAAVEQDARLSKTQRRDYRSAIRKTAELIGRPLDKVPAHLGLLRPLLAQVHPAVAGISAKRWQNIRSDLKRAIEHARVLGFVKHPARRPLPPDWQRLYDTLEGKHLRAGLSGFMRFCAERGIGPDEVDDASARDYFTFLTNDTLRKKPKRVYRDTCRLWNRAADASAAFPNRRLSVPSFKPPPKSCPWEDFPAAFRKEVEAHLRWLSGEDLLSDHQPPRAAKPSTLELRRKHIHLFASAAVRGGFPIEQLGSSEILVSRPVVEKAVQNYLDQSGGKKTQFIHDITNTMRLVAKHWVIADEEHLVWLRKVLQRLNPKRSGLTPKNRATLRQLDDEANLQRLLALPAKLMASVGRQKTPLKAAVRFQLGLIIQLLTVAPMRVSNLASLRLDTHITRPGGPRGGIDIVLGDHETKNAEAATYALDDWTRERFEVYLQHHRSHLVRGQDNGWVWPGEAAGHKNPHTISKQLSGIILKETGLEITPHQFRHLAAQLILDHDPGAYELARRVLGHKNTKTTVQFYAGLESRRAVAHYDRILDQRRQGAKRK